MLTIRTAAHIRGARCVKGFRSCPVSTGVPVPGFDSSRLERTEAYRCNHEWRRRWLARQWQAHQARVRNASERVERDGERLATAERRGVS